MIGALVYLQLTSLKNALRQRLTRLRQPRYLIGAIVGLGYFYFFAFRHLFSRKSYGTIPGLPEELAGLPQLLEPVGALVLFSVLALSWIFPSGRAALGFSEAEVAFLFPAPVTRRSLIHFKLVKSQIAILITSLILSLVTRRWAFLGGATWMHAVGWWLIFSFINLHLIAASFTRERLLNLGVNPLARRIVAICSLVIVVLATTFWLRAHLAPPEAAQLSDVLSALRYVEQVLRAPPLGWVLWPFQVVVRPFFAADLSTFLSTLIPTTALIGLHYFWVIRSEIAFEEASVDLARKRSETVAAVRTGEWPVRKSAKKPRKEPFHLSARGTPVVAFFWKNLITAGPPYYPRSWLITAVILVSSELWLLSQPNYRPLAQMFGIIAATIGAYALLLGPLLMRRGSQRMLERLDVLKSYPLRGWQVIVGELLSPVALLSAAEWIVLLLLVVGASKGGFGAKINPQLAGVGALSLALSIPPLVGLMFAINFFAMLYFPAWSTTGQQGPGIEKLGQRLIFFGGYVLVLLFSLLPAAGLGAMVFFLTKWGFGQLSLSIILTGFVAATILAAEFASVMWWLGRRYEAFDLSAEMPR